MVSFVTNNRSRDLAKQKQLERRTGAIRISLEMISGAARSRVPITAERIERAVDLARVRHPGSKVEVPFPVDPESCFDGKRLTGGRFGQRRSPHPRVLKKELVWPPGGLLLLRSVFNNPYVARGGVLCAGS